MADMPPLLPWDSEAASAVAEKSLGGTCQKISVWLHGILYVLFGVQVKEYAARSYELWFSFLRATMRTLTSCP